jgi:hypothetical protein
MGIGDKVTDTVPSLCLVVTKLGCNVPYDDLLACQVVRARSIQ